MDKQDLAQLEELREITNSLKRLEAHAWRVSNGHINNIDISLNHIGNGLHEVADAIDAGKASSETIENLSEAISFLAQEIKEIRIYYETK